VRLISARAVMRQLRPINGRSRAVLDSAALKTVR
jgi:hypothetical protein